LSKVPIYRGSAGEIQIVGENHIFCERAVPQSIRIVAKISKYPVECYRGGNFNLSLWGGAVAFHKIVERFYFCMDYE
jgi:hypothetical protein